MPDDLDPSDPQGRTTTQRWRDRCGDACAARLIQRFGWYGIPAALNLNIHFHILFLDGVYVYRDNRSPRFQRVRAPDKSELEDLVQSISQRVGRCLERLGLPEQDAESAWLELDPAEETDAMPHLLGSSVFYRIAVGPQQGQKAFMIRTIRPLDRPDRGLERVALDRGGQPPVDFIARLAALVPKPRVNLIRYHGVLAPARPTQSIVGAGRSLRPGVAKGQRPSTTPRLGHPSSTMRPEPASLYSVPHQARCLFSLGEIPAQQHSTRKEASENRMA